MIDFIKDYVIDYLGLTICNYINKKYFQAIDISINKELKLFGIFPTINFKDKGSYIESSTREYDILAFKYLSRAIYPLLICYGIYSLIYQEHKGWYSWILSMLYGFLLTFGYYFFFFFFSWRLLYLKMVKNVFLNLSLFSRVYHDDSTTFY